MLRCKLALLALVLCCLPVSAMSMEAVQPKLDKHNEGFKKEAPKELVDVFERGIKTIEKSGILAKALNVGAKAPDFSLTDATGKTVTLSKLLEKGPVVVTWYRGGWCPYCNIYLQHLREYLLPELKKHNGDLIAISPEIPDKTLTTKQKLKLPFHVLTDKDNSIAAKYGIVYTLPKEVSVELNKFVLLKEYNGNDTGKLPLSATYIINKEGIITYAFIDADYRKRAEPEVIIEAIKANSTKKPKKLKLKKEVEAAK